MKQHKKKHNIIIPFLAVTLLFSFTAARADHVYAIDEKLPGAKESYYSTRLFKILKNWPRKDIPALNEDSNPVWIRAVKTPGNETYVGVERQIRIHAPLQTVATLIEDFTHYKERNKDFEDIHVTSKDGNKITAYFEVQSPAFFIANTRYEQIFIVDHSSPDRVIYRYQLKQGNNLNFADGLFILETQGDHTIMTGFDFFDAQWGALASIATGKIWKKSVEGYYRGDIALKAQAEHPDWKAAQIEKEVDRFYDLFPIDPVQFADRLILDEPATRLPASQ